MQVSHLVHCSLSLPRDLVKRLQEKANQHTDGNRSRMATFYIIEGMESERKVPGQEALEARKG